MRDQKKTKQQLITERDALQARVEELEAALAAREVGKEDALQDPSLMETVLDNLPALVYIKDLKSRHLFANKQDLKLKGATKRSDIVGKTDEAFFDPDEAAVLMADERQIIETGTPLIDKEECFKDKNHNVTWLMTTKIPWLDKQGQKQGIIGIGQNITRRKQELDILNEINLHIVAESSLHAAMEQIVFGAMRLSNTSSGIIYLVSKSDKGYQVTHAYRYPHKSEHPNPRVQVGAGLTHEVITKRQPIPIPTTRTDTRVNPELIEMGVEALLAVPLKRGDDVIGVLFVNDHHSRKFTANEISLLSIMADYAVVALDNTQLIQEKDDSQRLIAALHESGGAFIALTDSAAVLKTMIERAPGATHADWATIVLIDDRTSVIKQLITYPEDNRFTVDMIRPAPDGNSLRVFTTGETYCIEDVENEPERVNQLSIVQGFKSVIGLPLTVENQRRIGVLWLHYKEQQHFTPPQVRALELYANQGAIIYNNVLHQEKLERMVQITRAIASAIPVGDKDKTLRLIVSGIYSVMNCDAASLYVFDPYLRELEHPPTLVGLKQPEQAKQFGVVRRDSIIYKMLDRDTYYIADDVHTDPFFYDRPFVERENVQTCMAIPLIAAGQKAGVLFVNYREHHRFTDDEVDAIRTFADQAAVAILNAQLFERTRYFLNQAEQNALAFKTLHTMSLDISGIQDIDDILEKIVMNAIQLTEAEHGVIYLFRNPEGQLQIAREVQHPKDHPYPSPRLENPDSVISHILLTGESVIADDIRLNQKINPTLYDLGVRSLIAVPLKSDSKVIGILYVNYTRPHRFSPNEITILNTLASDAAIAISNEQRRLDQIETLRKLARTIVLESEQQPTLNGIIQWVQYLMPDLVWADIRLLNRNADWLEIKAFVGTADDVMVGSSVGEGITGWVAQYNEYRYVPDVSKDEQYRKLSGHTQSELVVPMADEGKVIGVLNIERPRINGFTDTDIKLAMAVAEIAVVAFQNTTQYQRIETDRRLQIQAVRQMTDSIAASSEGVHETLQVILALIALNSTVEGEPPCVVEILTLDEPTHSLNLLEGRIESGPDNRPVRTGEIKGVFEEVIQQTHAVIVSDVHAENSLAQPRHTDTRSQLLVPVLRNDKVFGLLNVEHPLVNAFTPDFLEVAQAMAQLVLIAIEHSKRYEEVIKSKRIIGGRTALAWMNMASGVWYHEIYGAASTINNWLKLATDDVSDGQYDRLPVYFQYMNVCLQKILNKRELIPQIGPTKVDSQNLKRILSIYLDRLEKDHAKAGVKFQRSVNIDESVDVAVNAVWLEKALDILVNNGINAMSACPDQIIIFTVTVDGNSVTIAITDMGKGIQKEVVEAFGAESTQYEEGKQGLGIGLTVAQAIVEHFGGHLEIGHTGKEGTTMLVHLPVVNIETGK